MSIIDHRQAVRPASSLLIELLITRGICGYAEVSESKRETRADIRASECERILRARRRGGDKSSRCYPIK